MRGSRTLRLLFPALAAAAALCGCREDRRPSGDPRAPAEANVCGRIDAAGAFRPVAYGVPSLEQCAIFIDGVHLQEHHDVTGLWNGVYIHADARDVTASVKAHHGRYPIFRPTDRARIDAALSQQIARRKDGVGRGPASSLRREVELTR